ncbi:MAG: site-specific integrase [bacterium]
MTIKKEGNNKWYCEFMIDGIRFHKACKGATSAKEAQQFENLLRADIMRGDMRMVGKRKKHTFKQAVDLYLHYSKLHKKSYPNDINSTNLFVNFWGANHRLDHITPASIEAFIESIKEKQIEKKVLCPITEETKMVTETKILKNGTINRHLQALSKLFNIAISNKLLSENPMKGVPKLKENNYKTRYLTKEEQVRLFEQLGDGYLSLVVLCALHTGMRRSEILKLKWSCIDFSKNYIELLETKSYKSRKIPLSSILKEKLQNMKVLSDYVFTNPKTMKPYNDFGNAFESALERAGIDDFVFHDLRHSAATRMVEKGIDLVVVKELLGHSSIVTTVRYAHAVSEIKSKAIELLSEY